MGSVDRKALKRQQAEEITSQPSKKRKLFGETEELDNLSIPCDYNEDTLASPLNISSEVSFKP